MITVVLLILSNAFMTMAWYGHLKFKATPLALAILVSWMIALPEYMLAVTANRLGHEVYTTAQLKTGQEAITLVVFSIFAYAYLGEQLRWNYLASFACLFAAVLFAFWGRL